MENSSERLHYAIALGLGVVGLLIILIFVSIRSQADSSTPTTSVSVTDSSPTVTIVGYGTSTAVIASAFTLDPETNVLANSMSTTLKIKATIVDANGCDQMNGSGMKGWFVYKSGTPTSTCDYNSSSPSSDNCFNQNSPGIVQNYNNCSGGSDTTGDLTVDIPMPYRTPNADWVMKVKAYDGTNLTETSGNTMAIQSTNGIKITNGSDNTAKTSISFGTVAVGATSSQDIVKVSNVGNYNGGYLTLYGTKMNCSAGSEPTINTSSIKYATSTGSGTAISSGGSLPSGSSNAVTTTANFARTPASNFSSSSVSYSSTTYFALDLTSEQGAAGACTGTVSIVLN